MRKLYEVLVSLLVKIISALPDDDKEEVFNNLIEHSSRLRMQARKQYYSPTVLTDSRFEIKDIRRAIKRARSLSPNSKIYLLSDIAISSKFRDIEYLDSIEAVNDDTNESAPVFVCVYESDEKLLGVLKEINQIPNARFVMPGVYYPTARYFHRNDIARDTLIEDSKINKPKFEVGDFENIIQALEITRHIPGDYVEIGVYQGRSAHLALNYMSRANLQRKSFFLDVFEGFTYDKAQSSSDLIWKNTHQDTSFQNVQEFLAEFNNVQVIKSNIITDELPEEVEQISVCCIDVDLQEAVNAAINKVSTKIAKGGLIILEDQGHTPPLGGAYLATCEFLDSATAKSFVPIHMASGQMILVKTE